MENTTFIMNGTFLGISSTYDNQSELPVAQQNAHLGIFILARFHLVAIPIITTFGFIGNMLAFFVFISKSLRRTSCSWYLAARSLSDTGFLVCLFVTWLGDAFGARIFHKVVICQCVIFLTYVCGFLSVWLVVMITLENYIRICHPFTVARFCNILKAKTFIVGYICIGVVLYNFPLWTTHVVERGQYRICDFKEEYLMITHILIYGDMIITLVIPSLAIIFLMVAITISVIKSFKRQTRLRGKQNCSLIQNGSSYKRSNSPQAKVTRMLFAVSFIFLALNLPSHVIRLRIVLLTFMKHRPSKPTLDQIIQVVFQIIYYLSFAVNLIVYLSCGDNFRKVFVERYCCCFTKSTTNRMAEPSHTSFTVVPGKVEYTDLLPGRTELPEINKETRAEGENKADENNKDDNENEEEEETSLITG